MTKSQKTINPNERQFQTWFKSNFTGWVSQFHPAVGSDIGCPDLFVLLNSGNVTPVELKIGSLGYEHDELILSTKEIRPAQIRWHHSLSVAGGFSMIVVGVWAGTTWRVFAINSVLARQWDEKGFVVGSDAIEIDPDDLVNGLADFMFSELGE